MMRALILATIVATPALAQQGMVGDAQWASEGQYLVYASPWCAAIDRTLQPGRDYSDMIAWQKGALPSQVQISWRWPSAGERNPKCGVFGYNHVAWGNYDGGATIAPVQPRQVSRLQDFTVGYGIDVAADPASYNGLAEFYLTTTAGQSAAKVLEVGWLWNAPPATRAWASAGQPLGTMTDRYGKGWTVRRNAGFVTFIPATGAQPWGTIDAKGSLDWLRARGIITGSEWINGMAIGVEPLGGIGTVIVRHWRITLN